MSTGRWMDKEDTYIHTIEYCLAIKRWNLGIWDSMDGPYMLTRMNLRWKKTDILLFHLYVAYKNKWNKQTNQMNKPNWDKQVDTDNRVVITRREESGVRARWAKGKNMRDEK